MLQSNLSYFFQMGASRSMSGDRFPDKTTLKFSSYAKAPILLELGRVVRSAYEQGVTLEEAYAICGAAFGDWREAHESRTEGVLQDEATRIQR